jgi:hypothetical protein
MDRLDNECKKYDNIIAILDRLPTELGWSLPFLPVTKHAMLPNAMLTNTNEVQVHIGDGWFTRCSAHHAKGICRRRQESMTAFISMWTWLAKNKAQKDVLHYLGASLRNTLSEYQGS